MPLDQPTEDLRGLLVPIPSLVGATITADEQAGPIPGSIEVAAGLRTEMVLEASGTLTTAVRADIGTAQAGHPRPGGGTFRWDPVHQTVTANNYRSWNPPWVMSGWEYAGRSTTAGYWTSFHAASLADGRALCVAVRETNKVYVWRETVQGVFSSALVEDTGHATTATIAVAPSGRVFVWYTYYLTVSRMTVRMAYSDDDGATWTVGATTCIPRSDAITAATSTILRIRVVLYGGAALMVIWKQNGGTDSLYQYVSDDGGCSFSLQETISTADEACPDMIVRNGVIYLVTIENNASAGSAYVPYLRKLTSPTQSITGATKILAVVDAETAVWGTFAGGVFTGSECAVVYGTDGAIYLYGAEFTAGRKLMVYVSYDDGETWLAAYDSGHVASTAMPIWMDDTSTYLRDYTVTWGRSRVAMFHRHGANPGAADDSLSVAWLGGWDDIAQPEDTTYAYQLGTAGWKLSWLPIDLPEDIGATWTKLSTGAPTAVLGTGGMHVTTAGGEDISWYTRPVLGAGDEEDGILGVLELLPVSGTAFFKMRISDATNAFGVHVHVTTTSIGLYDDSAGLIGSAATATTTNGVRVKISIVNQIGAWAANTGSVRAWYMLLDSSGAQPEDCHWVEIERSNTLVSIALTTTLIEFGMETGAGECYFRWLGATYGTWAAGNTAARSGNPTRGHYFPTPISPAHLSGGLRIHAISGPTTVGDRWYLEKAYRYPARNIDIKHSPSPQARWRSTTEGAQNIEWTADCGFPAGELFGIYLQGINWRTGALYGGATGVTKICDIDTAIKTGLAFTRDRDCVYPTGSAGNSAPFFLHEESVAGGTFRYAGGGAIRKIAHNTAGQWLSSAASGNRGVRLYLDSYIVGDTASGAGGILCPDRVLIITDLPQSSAVIKLHIDAQTTVEGYLTVGVAMLGRVQVFGRQYGRNRSREWRPNYAISESPSGVRSARRRGLLRRAAEISWDDGIDLSQSALTVTPADYVSLGYTSAPPIAARGYDLPDTLGGILSRGGGAELPVVYIPSLPQAASAPTTAAPITITDSARMLYSRMTGEAFRVDNVFGDEYQTPNGEFGRLSKLRFEEEL